MNGAVKAGLGVLGLIALNYAMSALDESVRSGFLVLHPRPCANAPAGALAHSAVVAHAERASSLHACY